MEAVLFYFLLNIQQLRRTSACEPVAAYEGGQLPASVLKLSYSLRQTMAQVGILFFP